MPCHRLARRFVRSLSVLALAAAAVAPFAPVDEVTPVFTRISLVGAAHAQSARQIVAGPITTKRFERLAQLMLSPTPEEMAALDRLHDRYLEKFRAEIDGEITALASSMTGGMPTKEQYERFMRDSERVSARIADADNAFFNAAAEAVAESRRGGIARFKNARERQRALSGMVRFAPMMFGSGSGFVDIADMLANERYLKRVPAEARPQLDSFLATQETRVLVQARSLGGETRDALGKYFDVMVAMMSPVAPENSETPPAVGPDGQPAETAGQTRMRALSKAMADLGKPIRKVLRANHADNRAAAAQLAAIMGRAAANEFRCDLAMREIGSAAYRIGVELDSGEIRKVAARIRRDRELGDEARAEIDAILERWHGERADALEAIVAQLDASERGVDRSGRDIALGGDDAPGFDAEKAAKPIAAANDRAIAALVALLGARVEEYFDKFDGGMEPGLAAGAPRYSPKDPDQTEDDKAETERMMRASFSASTIQPIEAARIAELMVLSGGDTATALPVIEGVRDAWESSQWEPRIKPLVERSDALDAKWQESDDEGNRRADRAVLEQKQATELEIATAAITLEGALMGDIAGALGLDAADPALLLAKLERVEWLGEAYSDGTTARVSSPARMFALVKAKPEEVRAAMEGARTEWTALAAEIGVAFKEQLAIETQLAALQSGAAQSARYEDGGGTRWAKEYGRLNGSLREQRKKWVDRVTQVFDAACDKAFTEADRREAFKRARIHATYPEMYGPSECAERELTDALALHELTDDQRAKIEALRAEYVAVFDALTTSIVGKSGNDELFGLSGDNAEAFKEYARKQSELEQLTFDRKQRTQKLLAELRRVLGPERAKLVRGLSGSDDAKTERGAADGIEVFGFEEEDDD